MDSQDFVAALARAAKSRQEIKSSEESVYGQKNISYSLMNILIKLVKDKKLTKMIKKAPEVLAAVTAAAAYAA
jgi:ribosomal protein L12E/L44/L45/RPP1/RPP2